MIKKNAIVRYKILDSLLSNRSRYYTTAVLTDKVNEKLEEMGLGTVSRRCIEKDINALQLAPYEAEVERYVKDGARCIRYADPSFSIFTKKLSDQEENLLSEVFNTLGQFDGLDNFEWLDGLKNRLEIKEHPRIIQFDNNPYLKNRNILGSLFEVIANKMVINLKYQPFRIEQVYEYIAHPYRLKEYASRWYLILWDEKWGFRNLPIDRIVSFEPLPDIPYVEPKIDLDAMYEDIVGITIYQDRPVEKILFWVSDSGIPYIESKPFHGSQTRIKGESEEKLRAKYPFLKEGGFFKLECKLNYEITSLLMSKMEQIVVLGPKELSNDIIRRVKQMASQYENFENL